MIAVPHGVLVLSFGVIVLGTLVFAEPVSAQSSRERPVWLDPDREAPLGSDYVAFRSSVVKQRVSCLVWLPPAYKRLPDKRFPVIYWLHGAHGNQRMFAEKFLPYYVDALKQRATPPAIVVAVNGIPDSFYGDSADGKCSVESVIVKDLIPHIDRQYRTVAMREGRLIEGFSMGGLGAARLGFKYPELFGAVAINSAGPLGSKQGAAPGLVAVYGNAEAARKELPDQLAQKNPEVLRKESIIRIACGGDDPFFAANKRLHEALERLEIPHVFVAVRGVDHDPQKFYETAGVQFFTLHRRAFKRLRDAPSE